MISAEVIETSVAFTDNLLSTSREYSYLEDQTTPSKGSLMFKLFTV